MTRIGPVLIALPLLLLLFDRGPAPGDDSSAVKVTKVPADLREQFKLDPFYKKYTSADGLPVLSSEKVSDAGLREAVYLIKQMLAERDDILKAMVKNRVRFVVMAPTEMTTDVPEQRNMTPKDYWDARARGLGGRITSCGEENLLNLRGDRYRSENILIHEFSHAIHRFGIGSLDPKFDGRLKEVYARAMDKGTWKDTYAATNHSEYWAEGVQAYFDCAAPPARGVHNDMNTREKLEKADPDLFALIDETFKKNKWRYVRYDKRTVADKPAPPAVRLTADTVRGLELRGIGPALTPGRIGDVAVDPRNRSTWYVVVSSGGLWKTTNRGLTWAPIFDQYGSYSLGCVTIDPTNPDVVWLGTGENQSQRSVGFGDGVYKSTDGGATWKNVGLRDSEHVARILIDPRNSEVVYVAAQGPLWAPGGDRGLYKTTDGGKTWKTLLQVSASTGITDVVFDPRDPNVMYAAAYQRRRNVGVLIGGGPESGIYKSVDGGEKWTKLTKGLPAVNMGRIALAVSPQQPDVVYALVTAAGREGGFYRSADRGESWVRQGDCRVQDPQYYGKIVADPQRFERVYVMDINVQVTDDGGKNLRRVSWAIHPDNHALVFDPTDANHLLVGNDGGLHETTDGGRSWRHFDNMPTTQFYRIAVDNALPFYNVYGGAQDNGTMGGPVRSGNRAGVRTGDWGVYGGGDGMQPRVDPLDPNTVYTMSQYGAINRTDRRTGTSASIRPRPDPAAPLRWNWDTPFLISPHAPTRLYLAANRLFRSDDRGGAWKAISPDLTRQLDRSKVEVMGRVWGADAVTPNLFTTELGVCTALAESPVQEGLLYAGTDDGLIQVSEDGGKAWRKIESFPSVPDMTSVSALCASQHDAKTVYAAFDNHLRGDFKPYLLRSSDAGQTWTSIAGNLPARHHVWCVVEDHVNKDLLFAGTEFGLFFTADGGKEWVQFRGGAPTVAFRDLAIQKRENDLVCGTFGRGIFVLDDYTPLRHLTPETLAKDGVLFPVRKVVHHGELPFARPAGQFAAPNPPSGATFTYHLREAPAGNAKVVLTVADAGNKTVHQINGPTTAGLHRIHWDLRTGMGGGNGRGRPAATLAPGKYKVTLAQVVAGKETTLGVPQEFEVAALAPVATAGVTRE